jgi:hypothetical protein
VISAVILATATDASAFAWAMTIIPVMMATAAS